MVTCGECHYCIIGSEQFCEKGKMIGKNINGGYAEYIAVPSRGIYKLPDSVSFEHAAVMMCSAATSFHALKKTRFQKGETLAIFGFGGLGVSAFQLAHTLGARDIYVIDIDLEKLESAKEMGAIPINVKETDPVEKIMELTNGVGVNVALELVGLPQTLDQGTRALARFGRLGLVGITRESFEIDSYDAICKEKELIGCSDHLLSEIPILLDLAKQGELDLSQIVTKTVPLEAEAINMVHHQLKDFKADFRTVIMT
jgi:propanol-preferring alcohol dehydrogenase